MTLVWVYLGTQLVACVAFLLLALLAVWSYKREAGREQRLFSEWARADREKEARFWEEVRRRGVE